MQLLKRLQLEIPTTTTAVNIDAGSGQVNVTSPTATVFSTGLSTAPVNSSVATAAFVTAFTAATSYQNTTGYDLMVNICVEISAATTATLTLGVGSATSPTINTVVPSFSVAAATFFTLSAIVPNNYYIQVASTGTPTLQV